MSVITYELTRRRIKGRPRRATKPALALVAVVEFSDREGTRVTLYEHPVNKASLSIYVGRYTLSRVEALAKAEARAVRIATFWRHAGLSIRWPE